MVPAKTRFRCRAIIFFLSLLEWPSLFSQKSFIGQKALFFNKIRLLIIYRDLKHRQRNARRRRLQPKEDWVEGFVLRLVALAMTFKNVRNLLLINHNDGFIDDDQFVLLYNLFASQNLDFPYDSYAIDLEELDESESFAEFRFRKRDIRTLKEVQFCKSLT